MTAPDIRGLKPLLGPTSDPFWPWLVALGAAALLGGLWAWRRAQRLPAPPRSAPPSPRRSDYEEALLGLAELAGFEVFDPPAVRRLHFELSERLRTWVEACFGVNATDLTTEEIVVRLAAVRSLPRARTEELANLLQAADGVKFAAEPASEAACRARVASAIAFVEATRGEALEAAA
ncbi:MAG TPA: hypothetical protein VF017_16625 [Thermoanaerobaculia bacterium]|nr:hypothetical protein [Thermoanaerobaculia bacterium]